MIGGIVLFQLGIQNVDISIGVVGREILRHSCFLGPLKSFYHRRFTFVVDRILVNIIFF